MNFLPYQALFNLLSETFSKKCPEKLISDLLKPIFAVWVLLLWYFGKLFRGTFQGPAEHFGESALRLHFGESDLRLFHFY